MEKRHKGVYEKLPGSNIWWIRWTDASGIRRKKKIGAYAAACKYYDAKSLESRVGVLPTQQHGAKLSELVTEAIAYAKGHHKAAKDFEQRVNLVLPAFGNRPAHSITTGELQRWMDKMAAERDWTPGTRNRVRSSLSTVWREAQRSGKVRDNPARLLRRAKEGLGRVRFLSEGEELALRGAILRKVRGRADEGGEFSLLQLDVALHTGMRRGEQFTATWDQVDLEKGFIYLSETKNGSDRYVHLNTKAKGALIRLRELADERGFQTGVLLFLGRRGEPIQNPKKWFETATRVAGLKAVTWHTLRHTFASRLVMKGVDLKTVQELMGHKSIAMTARYAHLAPDHKLKALETLV